MQAALHTRGRPLCGGENNDIDPYFYSFSSFKFTLGAFCTSAFVVERVRLEFYCTSAGIPIILFFVKGEPQVNIVIKLFKVYIYINGRNN